MIKVSIIIPVYNAGKYLSECLESIINQTLKDIEIICVNDGSTDNSLDILEDYAKKDNRIKIISTENSGAGHARNIGLDNCQGEYLYFMDADDFIDLNTLEEIYNLSKDKDLEMLMFPLINYDDEEDEYFNSDYYDMADLADYVGENVFNYEDIDDLIFKIAVSPVNKLYNNEFINKFNVRFPEGTIFEDNIFFWNAFLNAEKVLFVKKYYYKRRIHHSSVMSSSNAKFIDTIKIHNMIFDIFQEHNIFNKFKSNLFNKKVSGVYNRLFEVEKNLHELFFTEIKKDFQLMSDEYGHDEILSYLTTKNIQIFNNALISRTAKEFKLLMAHFSIGMKNDEIKSENKELRKEIKRFKKENNTLLSSNSWKITKPLRFIRNFSIGKYFLNRSNSYLFYKNEYEKLTHKNNNLKRDVKKIEAENKRLLKDKNHSQSQSDVYHGEATQLNDKLNYIYDKSSEYDNLEDKGLFIKLLGYKDRLDELDKDIRELYKNDMARIDLRNFGIDSNGIEIIENSASNPLQSFPRGFVIKEGKRIIIEACCGKLDLKIRAINDGILKVFLRSIYYANKNLERVDFYIEYTSLIINGVNYLDKPDLYGLDNPFIAEREVKDSEILDIHIEWVTYDRTNPYDGNRDMEEIYQEIRNDLIESDLQSDALKKMPLELYSFYIRVLNYESYYGYLNFNNALKTNHNHVNKKEMQHEIDNFTGYGLNTEKRDESIVVSLTSFPERMEDIHFCLYSLLTQNFKPDKVILWLADEQFPNKEDDVPESVLKLKENGLTIRWCHDIKSYKKLIFILKENPDDFIVTADDDIYYHNDWLEKIWNTYLENPNTIISSRPRVIAKDENRILDYYEWKLSDGFKKPSYLNFPTGAGGTMYFPGALCEKVFDEDKFMRICPTADDIWFWAMAILNNTKITGIDNPYNFLTYVNVARETGVIDNYTLWNLNKTGKNDEQLKDIFKEFPEILEKINNE